MKVLITGGTGLLGKALIEENEDRAEILITYVGDYELNDPNYFKIDIRNKAKYATLFGDFRPDVVIHTASMGSPDYAEKNQEITYEVNVCGVQNILELCEEYDSSLVHISSNGIYDGEHAPYREEDRAQPINYYGKVKLEGEKLLLNSKIKSAVVRPILMYGWPNSFERGNIVTFALEKLKKGESLNVYNDVYSNPIFNLECAKAIWKIIRDEKYESFNVAGADRVSIYELVKTAAQIFDLNLDLIHPVKQGFFGELVKRPKDTSYDTSKMKEVLGVIPLSLREGLLTMKEKIN